IFKRLMRSINRPDLAEDPALADNAGRDARREELYAVIDAWTASLEQSEVLRVLAEAEVPASRIYSVADMFTDPQFIAREMFVQGHLPDGKAFSMPGIVPKLSGTPGATEWVGPALGEHTEAILSEMGYSEERIRNLRTQAVI
ncbi:MAG: CoA transferase, partial [Pseudomonas sp.]|nr:CoA transferase [Pseudomonas sp.]